MDEASIKNLLDSLGCQRISNRGPQWIQCACPFQERHKKHRDSHPSFGIRINPTGTSGWFCYTCKERGWIGGLPATIERFTGRRFDQDIHETAKADGQLTNEQIRERLAKVNYWQPSQTVGGVRFASKNQNDPGYKPEIIPREAYQKFTKHTLESVLYLQGPKRKLTIDTIRFWGLGWDEDDRRVVVPICDAEGNLVAWSRRLYEREGEDRRGYNGKKPPKYLHSKGFKRDYFLYGEHARVASQRHAYIVEGFFDVIWLWQCGYRNPLAIMGSYLSDIQERRIKKWFDRVTIIADGDQAGSEMAHEVAKTLRPDVLVDIAYCPEDEDANNQDQETLVTLVGVPDILVV